MDGLSRIASGAAIEAAQELSDSYNDSSLRPEKTIKNKTRPRRSYFFPAMLASATLRKRPMPPR